MSKSVHIALVGNPNSGKSSLFNELTGLKQKVGNFPGVTVDKKTGQAELAPGLKATFIDLPGTYSLYPKRADEWVSYKVLLQQDPELVPDMLLVVADASNLRRNLLFCSQIIDLKIPVVIALTMMDLARQKGTQIDIPGLERELGVPIVAVNPRKGKGMGALKRALEQVAGNKPLPPRDFADLKSLGGAALAAMRIRMPELTPYAGIQALIHYDSFQMTPENRDAIAEIIQTYRFNATRTQAEEIMQRYARIRQIMQQTVVEKDPLQKSLFTEKLDGLLLHRTWGYAILFAVLFLLFQSVFWIAQYPMDGIEWLFGQLSGWLGHLMPESWFSDLFINGFIAGLSGIFVFVPQIMILFGLITLLEDTGYMARISFLTDKLMRKVGLNGKSVMPMISGFACAVPAIMSARNIENRKERLLTILVTPLMSCSARLPVYTILIALVIPSKLYFGFLSLQGLVMMLLYMFGTVMAMAVAWVLKRFIRSTERSFFILELPVYRSPRWKNVIVTMVEKARIFVYDAGKVIMVISLLLWALSHFGPSANMQRVRDQYAVQKAAEPGRVEQIVRMEQADLLRESWAGQLGRAIEPAIAPLGFDWKIGIALITSFAAREVFVGTMATLYSVGEEADEHSSTLREKMQAAVREDGTPVYSLATGLSLMVFYVLAMQCMSTIAVVKRETRSWTWAMVQLAYMTALAYLMSWLVYIIFR